MRVQTDEVLGVDETSNAGYRWLPLTGSARKMERQLVAGSSCKGAETNKTPPTTIEVSEALTTSASSR
jgi:hypothetical protein